jgi:hypothetical protein
VELPAKGVMAEEGMSPFPPAVVRAVLDPMCAGPCIEIKRLVDECRAVTKFMAEELPQKVRVARAPRRKGRCGRAGVRSCNGSRKSARLAEPLYALPSPPPAPSHFRRRPSVPAQVAGTLDLEADLLPETYEQLGRISLADFDARTFKRFAAFWSGSTAAASDGPDHHHVYADGGGGSVAAAPAVVQSVASNGTGGPAVGSSEGMAGGSAQTLTSASGVDTAPPLTKRHLPSSPDDGGPMAGAGLSFTTASRSLSLEPLAAAASAAAPQQPAAGAAGGPPVAAAAAGQPPQPAALLAATAPAIAAGAAAAATAAAVSARGAGPAGPAHGGHWPAADPAPPLQMPSRGTTSVNGGQTVTVNGHDGPGLRFGTTSVGGLDDGARAVPTSPGRSGAGAAAVVAAGAGAGSARYAVAAEQSGESKGTPAPGAAAKLGQAQPAAVQPQPFKGDAGAPSGAAADGAGLPSSQTLHGTPSSGQPSQPPLPTPSLAPLSGTTALITGTPGHGSAPPAAS